MKLHVTKRSNEQRNEAKRLRREGKIPAVVYNRGKESDAVSLEAAAFDALLRKIPKGRLPTTVFSLIGEGGKERRAIIKDIQYHVTTYAIEHLDFEVLSEEVPVSVKVPIECAGVVDCIGVKQGGVLRTVMRHVRVRCLPKDIPSSFVVNVADLEMLNTKRLKHLSIPQTIRLMASENDVAVIVAKR
jgi:large subunit ribosomal protein L25